MFDINRKIEELAACKPARKKRRRRSLSLHEEVLSLVQSANSQVAEERRVDPRNALAVMNRTLNSLGLLGEDSKRIAVIREVSKFISLQHDTNKAHFESTNYGDLLPIGHPLSTRNALVSAEDVRKSYATWLAADNAVPSNLKSLVSSAFASAPFSIERKHAFTRLSLSKDASVPLLFKIDPIVAAFSFRGGNSSAARRARVALQWRDRLGRWVEMGRGIDFNFRLPDGSIGSAGGTYVGVNAARGYSTENGNPVANAGLVEIRGDSNIPDGIYSIESANASPVKARIPGQALKRAKVRATPSVRKPTAEQAVSKDIPSLEDLLKTKVDAPSGWTKQRDGSFLSDDDYKAIPTDSGYSLYRLDKDGNTGEKVGDASSWADVQSQAEKDSDEYDKFKESVGIQDTGDSETKEGIEQARAVQEERKATIPDEEKGLIPEGVNESGTLENGVTYKVEEVTTRVEVFPGRYTDTDAVKVTLDGNTYENRQRIKQLGFKWNNTDKVWVKNYVNSDLFGKWNNTNRIKEELDGVGGKKMPRYKGDNNEDIATIQEAHNSMFAFANDNGIQNKDVPADIREQMKKLMAAQKDLQESNDGDRELAREKLNDFISNVDSIDLENTEQRDKAKAYAQKAVDSLSEKIGDSDMPESDKEVKNIVDDLDKATEIPTKTVSKKSDSVPELFDGFDTPKGAFRLLTAEYEAEGRIDQESTDYTDSPERLAVRFPLPILVRAFTESLIGKKDDDVIADIIDSNLGDDDESLDLEDLNDVVDTPAPRAGRANATGAGGLEFNAGEEFVPAEALYNAVYRAGGDPNRVIANAYDAVHGDRRNLQKLTQEYGELPSQEEQQIIDDMMEEIRQIEDKTPDGEAPVSNIVSEPEQDALPGKLISNIPVEFDNPDFYVIDPNPYVPSVPELDENNYTDSPEFLARNFEEADLIQQLTSGITDGSGSAYLSFNDEEYLEGVFEVPVEAIRDALQLLDVNTNVLLEDLKNKPIESVKQPQEPEAPQAVEQQEGELANTPAVQALKQRYSTQELQNDLELLMYLPADGSIAFKDAWGDLLISRPDGKVFPLNVTEEWLRDPKGAGQAGWRDLTDEEKRQITGAAPVQAEAPEPEPTPAPAETPAAETPRFQYPGPRESGYSPNNTTLVRGGVVVGKGSRVVATKDGKAGTVVAIQNDPEYLRIKFDDGTTAVRAAAKVKALSDPSGVAPTAVKIEKPKGAQDIQQRLDRPILPAPRVARSGDTPGVNDESTRPAWLDGLTNEDAKQSDFSDWGTRDAEIAKAATDRISLENLTSELTKLAIAMRSQDVNERVAARTRTAELMGDIYGAREGITFGGEFYSVSVSNTFINVLGVGDDFYAPTAEDIEKGRISFVVNTSMEIRNVSGNRIGEVRRDLTVKTKLDEDKNVIGKDIYAKNEYLSVTGGGKKKGFATAFNRYSENWYIANGIEKVKVYAAGGGQYQGGFVWALSGFGWDPEYVRSGISIASFKRQVSNKEEELQVELLEQRVNNAKKPNGQYDLSLYPTPMEFALVGWYPGAKDWLGKKVLISTSWNGVKTLKPDAKEQVQAANYTQIKNAERRIESKQNIPNVTSDGLAVVASDSFRNDKKIAPYYAQINDTLKNNKSLATLSPDAKSALNAYISDQLLDKNRKMPIDDIFRLRGLVENEYRADYGYSDPFNSAEILSEFTTQDFVDASNSISRGEGQHPIKEAGFTVRKLSYNEGGVNSTFEVTHDASGQVFYVKNEEFAARFSNVPGGVTELEAVTLLRAAGMQGIHDVRIGKQDQNLIIMSRAGSAIPLANEAVNAWTAVRHGLKDTNGNLDKSVQYEEKLIKALDTPEDIIRMSIFDMLGNNQDRHNGNWMAAFDKATGKIRIFPVDNTVGVLEVEANSKPTLEFLEMDGFREADVYERTMPRLISSIGTENLLKLYKNEVDKIVTNLDNPLYMPKGFELDQIISKWGSYDAFRDEMASRLKKLVTAGNDEYNALKGALRLGYWG